VGAIELDVIILTILAVGVALVRIVERYRLDNNRAKIPIRIHVNGSRGKSSVTRLIAAALKGGGLRVMAKTTGTTPRIIYEDGNEIPLYRLGSANIREQFHVMSLAGGRNPDALILECMALQPHLQHLSETRIVQSTIGVITNARPDHLDVMGPSEEDVVKALAGTIPRGKTLVTAEKRHLSFIEQACETLKTKLVAVSAEDETQISNEMMSQFSYYEHRENIAIALEVAKLCGISQRDAFDGMISVQPDVGALTAYHLNFFGREIVFVHGFAANDPDSSELIWNLSRETFSEYDETILVLNLRDDRAERSIQLGDALNRWSPPGRVVLMGSGTQIAARTAVKGGFSPLKMVLAEDKSAKDVFEDLIGLVEERALIVGLGNVSGAGMPLVALCRNRGRNIPLNRFYPATDPSDSEKEDKLG